MSAQVHDDAAGGLTAKAVEAIRGSNTLSGPWQDEDINKLARAVLDAVTGPLQAQALREAAEEIRTRDGNELVAALLELECNRTAAMAVEWAEGVCRDRADRLEQP